MKALKARQMWLDNLQADGASPATTRAYSRHTLELLQDVARGLEKPLEKVKVEEVDRATIVSALAAYRARPDQRGGRQVERAASSVERRLAAVRAWLGWLVAQERLKRNPAASIRVEVPEGQRQPLGAEAFGKLLAAAESGRTPARDRVVLLLTGALGLRISEVAALKEEDVDLVRSQLRVRGRRERTVPLPQVVKDAVEAYQPLRATHLEGREEDPGTLLVTRGSEDGTYTAEALAAHLTRLMRSADVKAPGITPHSLRSGFAAAALSERILSPAEAREVLGSRTVPETAPGLPRERMLETHPFVQAAG